jgi:hypothetical protein
LWVGDVDGARKLALGSTTVACLRVAADAARAAAAMADADAKFRVAVQHDAGADELEALLERTETYAALAPRCEKGAGLRLAVLVRLKWHDASAAALESMLDAKHDGVPYVEPSRDVPGRRRAKAEMLPGAHGASRRGNRPPVRVDSPRSLETRSFFFGSVLISVWKISGSRGTDFDHGAHNFGFPKQARRTSSASGRRSDGATRKRHFRGCVARASSPRRPPRRSSSN